MKATRSTIDLAPVPDFDDKDDELFVLNVAENAVIANTIAPEIPQLRTCKSLANAAWIFELCNPFVQESQNSSRDRGVEVIDVVLCLMRQFNLPGHTVS